MSTSLPRTCTVRHLVTKYLDINAIPKRYFWELLSKFTDSDLERDKLIEFCTPAGQVHFSFLFSLVAGCDPELGAVSLAEHLNVNNHHCENASTVQDF